MSLGAVTFQIGKSGVTPAVVAQLNRLLEHHKHIRISALSSSGRNRETIKKMAASIASQLTFPSEHRIIGFTIALRKRASTPKNKK